MRLATRKSESADSDTTTRVQQLAQLHCSNKSKKELLPSQAKVVFNTLVEIFTNIVDNPIEVNLRTLEKNSEVVFEKLGVSRQVEDVLIAVGFQTTKTKYVLTIGTPPDDMKKASE